MLTIATLPGKMTAVRALQPGGPEVLSATSDYEIPEPEAGEILVRVVSAGVNRIDALQRAGFPLPGIPDILGVEVAGEVVARGPGAQRFKIGDAVCGLVLGGGYAEYVAIPESNALPPPEGVSLIHAGGLPEVYFTIWMNLMDNGRLTAGETLLVHGGTSGIGSAAIQLARAFGATVIATAGSREKCEACLALGAERAINYRDEDFVEAVRDFTSGRGVDLVLDIVGGDYVMRNYEATAAGGRILQVGFMRNRDARIDIVQLMLKRLAHLGASLRPQSMAFKAAIARQVEARVWPLFASGALRPVVECVLPLTQAQEAHRRLESSTHIGKLLLTP